MNIRKEFKTIILPVVKGLPIIIFLVMLAFTMTRRMVIYTNSIYQADGAIQIDTRDNSVDINMLFDDQKSSGKANNFLTEVESFKSKILIEKTLESLGFDISYFRVGKLKTKELYSNCPFSITFATESEFAYDRPFYLKYLGDDRLLLGSNEDFLEANEILQFDSLFINDQFVMTIKKEALFLKEKPTSLQVDDVFMFTLNTIEALQESVNASNLFIKPIDKEIQVIKVYFQHEVPEKAKLFVDALMENYIRSCQERITGESETTLGFIDEELETIIAKLKTAESRLAGYKAENGIINSKQETDASLKEIMQLDLQKVNYQLQEDELTKLFDFLSTGNNLQEFAPNFESLRGVVFRDAYMQAQKYELQKMDLLLKYTPISEEVQTIEAKVNNLRTFIHESVKTTLASISDRRGSLEKSIAGINTAIQTLPNKERQIIVLEREVKLNESLYNLMMEKRMELAISKTASVVGHQIIDPARLSKAPVWPNKGLIYGVSIFFALMTGILLSFLLHFLFGTVKSKKDLVDILSIPVIGTISKTEKGDNKTINAFANLYTNLEILKQKSPNPETGLAIATTSMFSNEGKTHTTVNLAKAFASVGKKVLVIDMDVRKPDVHRFMGVETEKGGLSAIIKGVLSPQEAILKTDIKNLDVIPAGRLDDLFSAIIFSPSSIAFISQLKSHYDFILIDTPPVSLVVDAVPLMHQSDFNLFVVRSGKSKVRKAKMIDSLIEEFQIPNVYAVLNEVKSKKKSYYYYPHKKASLLSRLVQMNPLKKAV